MNALIFIDTNIFLDFYRVRGREGSLSILSHIDQFHDRIITSSQVEMEYKKNRQVVILEALRDFKQPDWNGLKVPAFLAESQPRKNIESSRTAIDAARKKIKARIEKVLTNPSQNDDVYRTLQRLFKADSQLNLSRSKKKRFTLRRLACKRFMLGYPPRTAQDTSCGDAINWEWIIDCASHGSSDVVIVSRDSDYGVTHDDESFLNDWLRDEFKRRVSKKRNCFLTPRLTEGFKLAGVQTTKDEQQVEDELVREKRARPTASYEFIPAKQKVAASLGSLLSDWLTITDEPSESGS